MVSAHTLNGADILLPAQMVTMLHCQCMVCKECFHYHYSMMAHERNIAHFNCLVCSQPDLAATSIDKDDYLMLFAVLLKEHVSREDYQLFQKKAIEFSLQQDPTFRWCTHVSVHAQEPEVPISMYRIKILVGIHIHLKM